jgi:hypothetical protein
MWWGGGADRVLYDILLEYGSSQPDNRRVRLEAEAPPFLPRAVVPASALSSGRELLSGGAVGLVTLPAVVCAAASGLTGAGLTLATAGVPASFTVWARDVYGNLRDWPTVGDPSHARTHARRNTHTNTQRHARTPSPSLPLSPPSLPPPSLSLFYGRSWRVSARRTAACGTVHARALARAHTHKDAHTPSPWV